MLLMQALKANPKNDKAAFRAAKVRWLRPRRVAASAYPSTSLFDVLSPRRHATQASLALGRASEAAQFCELILTRDPEAAATVALLKEARAALGVQVGWKGDASPLPGVAALLWPAATRTLALLMSPQRMMLCSAETLRRLRMSARSEP